MSYTIEFDRQFIRSTRGITPVWLCGENNVTTGYGHSEKVARSWCVFLSILYASKEQLLDEAKSISGSQEHWKKGSKWINDEELFKWVENGCRQALPVEDIIEYNNFGVIDCYLHLYDGFSTSRILEAQVKTTFEFDAWLDQAKEEIELNKKAGNSIYPVVSFNSGYRITHTNKSERRGTDKVFIKKKGYYLVEACPTSSSWTKDPQQAKILTYDEALKLTAECQFILRDVKYVSAKTLVNPGNLVIHLTEGRYAGNYINKLTRSRFYYSSSIDRAHKYSTKAAAQKAVNRVLQISGPGSSAEIVEYKK